jgi:hypothetical protein
VTSLGGVLRPRNLNLADKTYRMHGNAATKHVQVFAIGAGAEHIACSPTSRLSIFRLCPQYEIFESSSPREPSSSPLFIANISCERLSCWPKLSYYVPWARNLILRASTSCLARGVREGLLDAAKASCEACSVIDQALYLETSCSDLLCEHVSNNPAKSSFVRTTAREICAAITFKSQLPT